jgi:hypothetical protein
MIPKPETIKANMQNYLKTGSRKDRNYRAMQDALKRSEKHHKDLKDKDVIPSHDYIRL